MHNGQHPSPDQKVTEIGDGMPSPEFIKEARERIEASCITHSKPREITRQQFRDAVHMSEEEFMATLSRETQSWRNERDEYGRMLDEMRANVAKSMQSGSGSMRGKPTPGRC